jgi:hypothetical protein
MGPRKAAIFCKFFATTVLTFATISVFDHDAAAANVIWDGGASTWNWVDAENWSTNILPQPPDHVFIGWNGAVTVNYGPATVGGPAPAYTITKLIVMTGRLSVLDGYLGTQDALLSDCTFGLGSSPTLSTKFEVGTRTADGTLTVGAALGPPARVSMGAPGTWPTLTFRTYGTEEIGDQADGTFVQNSGWHDVTGLAKTMIVGAGEYAMGSYEFYDGDLTAGKIFIGNDFDGFGQFLHDGGTSTVGELRVGRFEEGWYRLSEPANASLPRSTLNTNLVVVGEHSSGTFDHLGGPHNLSGTLILGDGLDGIGEYNLGEWQTPTNTVPALSAWNEIIGKNGIGTFNHYRGTNTVLGTVKIGDASQGNGEYYLQAGTLTAADEYVGYAGFGRFEHEGGTHTVSGTLHVGTLGNYYLVGNSSTVSANAMEVNGGFEQTAGSTSVTTNLKVGTTGLFKWRGGALTGNSLQNDGMFEISIWNLAPSRLFQQVTGSGTLRIIGGLGWDAGGGLPIAQNLVELAGGTLLIADGGIQSSNGTTFSNAGSFQLQNSAGISGDGSFFNDGSITVLSGEPTISIPFYDGGTIDTQNGSTMTLSGNITLGPNNHTINKYGSGSLKITGPMSVPGGAVGALLAGEGTTELETSVGGTFQINASMAGTMVRLKAPQTLDDLTCLSNATVEVAAGGYNTLTTRNLLLHYTQTQEPPSGRLDINDNWFHKQGDLGYVVDYLLSGVQGGFGVVSTTGSSAGKRIGYSVDKDPNPPNGIVATHAHTTWGGDANMDGTVNFSDLSVLAQH